MNVGWKSAQALEEAVRCPLQPRPRQAHVPDALGSFLSRARARPMFVYFRATPFLRVKALRNDINSILSNGFLN